MIEKCLHKVSCDVKNCKNTASYILPIKGRVGKLYICQQCLDNLIDSYNKTHIPKSPKNAIKKAMEINAKTIKEVQ